MDFTPISSQDDGAAVIVVRETERKGHELSVRRPFAGVAVHVRGEVRDGGAVSPQDLEIGRDQLSVRRPDALRRVLRPEHPAHSRREVDGEEVGVIGDEDLSSLGGYRVRGGEPAAGSG